METNTNYTQRKAELDGNVISCGVIGHSIRQLYHFDDGAFFQKNSSSGDHEHPSHSSSNKRKLKLTMN